MEEELHFKKFFAWVAAVAIILFAEAWHGAHTGIAIHPHICVDGVVYLSRSEITCVGDKAYLSQNETIHIPQVAVPVGTIHDSLDLDGHAKEHLQSNVLQWDGKEVFRLSDKLIAIPLEDTWLLFSPDDS